MPEPIIVPTILTESFQEFTRQAEAADKLFPYIQIDVMDGKFVPSVSFSERNEINALPLKLRCELHLMVSDPVAEMRRWQSVESVFRVLFHYEATPDPLRSISFARKEGWEIGLVINPDTPLESVTPFLKRVDVLQFMTVYPGRQGAPFEPKVLEKIKAFTADKPANQPTGYPFCAADGGINAETIRHLHDVGVEIFNVGSFFSRAADLARAYEDLKKALI